MFFEGTNSDHYIKLILTPLQGGGEELTDKEKM